MSAREQVELTTNVFKEFQKVSATLTDQVEVLCNFVRKQNREIEKMITMIDEQHSEIRDLKDQLAKPTELTA
ncbi:MAG: hypothetical protein U0798_15275 [Gemmataceae bacterium]